MIAFKAIFFQYLLLPLVAIILMSIMKVAQKKSAILGNKKLIVYILLAALLLGIPGFGGIAGNTFSPYWYMFVQVYFLGMGVLHVQLLDVYFKKKTAGEDKNAMAYRMLFEIAVTLTCMVLGMYIFVLLFNWLSPYSGFGWVASTSIVIFPVPLIFYYTYLRFTNIPFEIYKVWHFDPYLENSTLDGMDFDKLMVLNLEFTKKPDDGHRFSVKAKAPAEMILGDWFNRFIEDYNIKYPQMPIEIYNGQETHAWIFYTKRSFFHRRRYLDFEKNIADNEINEKAAIICKRVIQHEEEKVMTKTNKILQ